MGLEIRKFGTCRKGNAANARCYRVCKATTSTCYSNKNKTLAKATAQLSMLRGSAKKKK